MSAVPGATSTHFVGYRFSINFPRKDGPEAPQASADTLPASEEQNEKPSATSSIRLSHNRR